MAFYTPNNHNQCNTANTLNPQRFRYLVVLDFEATCARNYKIWPQEIIEWPAIIIDTKTNKTLSTKTFHYYIKPTVKPKLTKFCTELTGITQELMDTVGCKNSIQSVIDEWNVWCFENNLLPNANYDPNACVVTVGDADLKPMWSEQKQVSKCSNPALFHSWINVKVIFSDTFQIKAGGMMSMMEYMNIKHEGHHHSGIDDVRNTCKIVQKLLHNGVQFDYTTENFRSSIDINLKKHLLDIKKKTAKKQKKNNMLNVNNDKQTKPKHQKDKKQKECGLNDVQTQSVNPDKRTTKTKSAKRKNRRKKLAKLHATSK
eukprot:58220_1